VTIVVSVDEALVITWKWKTSSSSQIVTHKAGLLFLNPALLFLFSCFSSFYFSSSFPFTVNFVFLSYSLSVKLNYSFFQFFASPVSGRVNHLGI